MYILDQENYLIHPYGTFYKITNNDNFILISNTLISNNKFIFLISQTNIKTLSPNQILLKPQFLCIFLLLIYLYIYYYFIFICF